MTENSDTQFFPIRIRYSNEEGEYIVYDPSELKSGEAFTVLETNVPDEPVEATNSAYRELAGRIVYKLLAGGEAQFIENKTAWVNEYVDVLYILFPEQDDHLTKLETAVNNLLDNGIIIRFNWKTGAEDDDFYEIREL